MQQTAETHSSDLNEFIKWFKPDKFKLTSRGLELRSVVDMQGAMAQARKIIENAGLKLTVVHTAEMLAFRGFEVNPL
jgi:hypothetical protein